jgi:hypothetical protein
MNHLNINLKKHQNNTGIAQTIALASAKQCASNVAETGTTA